MADPLGKSLWESSRKKNESFIRPGGPDSSEHALQSMSAPNEAHHWEAH